MNGETAVVLTSPASLATTATAGSAAGSYPITASGAAAANYDITYVNGTLTVSSTAPVITWSAPAAAPYGTALSSAQLNATSGGVAGSFVYSPAAGTVLPVGTSTLSVQFTPTDTTNYKTVSASVQWVVNKAALTISAENKSRGYGEANPALTASYSGFVNGETAAVLTSPAALATTATAGSAVGNYPITASGAAAANYAITYVNGILTVSSTAPVITWSAPAAAPYGTALSAAQLNATSGGVAGSFVYSPAAGTALPVGTSTLTVQFTPTDTVNYKAVSASVAWVVNKTPLTITADNKSRGYGEATPTLTASYNGFVNGETAAVLTSPVVLITSVTASSPVGIYPITGSGAAAANYAIVYVNGILTVSSTAPVITWSAPTAAPYGTALSSAQLNANSGGVPGSFAYSPAAGTVLAAGTSTLSVQFTPTDTANYKTASASVPWVVNKAQLTITADNKSRGYGEANPQLTASYSGFVNGDGVVSLTSPAVATTTATAASHAGSYAITPGGAASANYTIQYGNGSLTITPVNLTITADNKSMVKGSSVPSLTASYAGFVNGETAAALATPASLTTTATSSSPAGTYPINASGATSPDYIITYLSGLLTVTPATLSTLSVSASSTSVSVGSTLQFTATGNYSDLTTKDVTATAAWISSAPSVAAVNSAGLATAVAAGSATISATYDSVSGALSLNVVSNQTAAATESSIGISTSTTNTVTFVNPSAITIPASGASTPYPSAISVSGMTGLVSEVSVTLSNLTHSSPRDIMVLLVSPAGSNTILMANAGTRDKVSKSVLTFDSAAQGRISSSTPIVSGTFLPTAVGTSPVFPKPAPAGPYVADLSIFNGLTPNGDWKLYVADSTRPNSGAIANGWQLTITSVTGASTPVAGKMAMAPPSLSAANPPSPLGGTESLPANPATSSGGSSTTTAETTANPGTSDRQTFMIAGIPPRFTVGFTNRQTALTIWGTVGAALTVQCATNMDRELDWRTITNLTLTDPAYSEAEWQASQPSLNALYQAFTPAKQVWLDSESGMSGIKLFRVVMPYDYAILADQVLKPKGYPTRLIAVRMPGLAYQAVCYVTPEKAYLHYDDRTYCMNLEGSGPTIREIATRVSSSLKENWTSASEFTYTDGVKQMMATVVKTDPPESDPAPGTTSRRITIGF